MIVSGASLVPFGTESMQVCVHFNHLKGNRAQEASRALSMEMLVFWGFFVLCFVLSFFFWRGGGVRWFVGSFVSFSRLKQTHSNLFTGLLLLVL